MGTEIARTARFDRIRYAQCWEDADVLLAALKASPRGTYLSVASAGDNTLALVGSGARRVIAVDLSPAQLACLELRVAAYRRLRYQEFLELLGQAPSSRRIELYARCRQELSDQGRRFWDAETRLLRGGIARAGKFERYLEIFRRRVLPLVHGRDRIERLFRNESEADRRAFFERQWNTRRWRLLCRLFFARPTLGRLGRDPSFARYADEPVWNSLERRIPHALVTQRPATNPYLQWILNGRYTSALPWALREENFDRIRANLDALEWHCAPVEEVLGRLPPGTLHGCNLSDIFEYMSLPAYEAALRGLLRCAAPGCRFVYWNVVVDRHRPTSLGDRLVPLSGIARSLHDVDKAFFYRRLVIEEVAA